MPATRASGGVELANSSLSDLSRPLPNRLGRVQPQQPRRAEHRAQLPPPPLDDSDARSDGDDGDVPQRAPLWRPARRAAARTCDLSEMAAVEASRAALDLLRARLRDRGIEDPDVLTGWKGTRTQRYRPGDGRANGWEYTFTDPDGETYRGLGEAACAAEPRDEDEETPSLLEEIHWAGQRYRTFAALEPW